MVDIASIVIAVISGVVALIAAGITTFFAWFSDERKRLSEAEKVVAKYRDPLLLASQDLQSRLYNIVDMGITNYFGRGGEREDDLLLYTTYLVGQYLSWTHVLRLQAQFLTFATDRKNAALTRVLTGIKKEFGTDKLNHVGGAPLMLWRGQQMAIGELMTVKEGEQLYCMGYAAFLRKWTGSDRGVTRGGRGVVTGTQYASAGGEGGGDGNEVDGIGHVKDEHRDEKDDSSEEFRRWLRSIPNDISHVARKIHEGRGPIPDQRLRRLQHLLLDLIHELDEKDMRTEADSTSPCHRAVKCDCTKCAGKPGVCPCIDLTACPWKRDVAKARHGPEHV